MKTSINRNFYWAEIFVTQLIKEGVKYAVISPGSRNTPLTLAFAKSQHIKTFVVIDERSNGFFTLGLAKKTNSPVAIVTTSGTAVAELYPAVIEAYQSRIPLIVCTADRPPELLNCGANQAINQNNIFKNHIRKFYDAGLPEPSINRLNDLREIAVDALTTSKYYDKGPVHINFPFRKPLEPESYTDEIESDLTVVMQSYSEKERLKRTPLVHDQDLKNIFNIISKCNKGMIICGGGDFDDNFPITCSDLSITLGYPIIADGTSPLRFGNNSKENVLENFTAVVQSDSFKSKYDPELILHFGNAPTSKQLLEFFKGSKAHKILINEFGDIKDPSKTFKDLIKYNPTKFCEELLSEFSKRIIKIDSAKWLNKICDYNSAASEIKYELIEKADFPFEGRIITELFNNIPENSNVMVSNSFPVRDVDFFAPVKDKSITLYFNRGASGIDGIISTAAGIAAESKVPTLLLTGDLAFFHDLNGLNVVKKYNIPLIIILINNNGSGIFEMLPISKQEEYFNDYFKTPHDLEFSNFVKAYGGKFTDVTSWNEFNSELKQAISYKNLHVLQIQTDSSNSLQIRKNYWRKVSQLIDKKINEDKNR